MSLNLKEKIAVIKLWNRDMLTWREMRISLVGNMCREMEWYKYHINGSRTALRDIGSIAEEVLSVAHSLGFDQSPPRAHTWCNTWRRTKQSIEAEEKGMAVMSEAVDFICRV